MQLTRYCVAISAHVYEINALNVSYMNSSQFLNIASALYLDFATETVKRGFLISNASTESV